MTLPRKRLFARRKSGSFSRTWFHTEGTEARRKRDTTVIFPEPFEHPLEQLASFYKSSRIALKWYGIARLEVILTVNIGVEIRPFTDIDGEIKNA